MVSNPDFYKISPLYIATSRFIHVNLMYRAVYFFVVVYSLTENALFFINSSPFILKGIDRPFGRGVESRLI